MKPVWQVLILATMGLVVLGLFAVLFGMAGFAFGQYTAPAAEPVQQQPIVINVPAQAPAQAPAPAQPAPVVAEPVELAQAYSPPPADGSTGEVLVQPTPQVEAVSIPAPVECTDLANIQIDTPYFKTFETSVNARVTLFNQGTCFWSGYYLAPTSTPVPDVLPGTSTTVEFVLPTGPGLTQVPITLYNAQRVQVPTLVPLGADAAQEFDYANPYETVPSGYIIVNWPTQDWEGLKLPEWKWYPGFPEGWFFLNGRGYCFGGS